ncbi:MAG: major capsid protein [Cyanobacteria bacterium P01_D01_bin.36]
MPLTLVEAAKLAANEGRVMEAAIAMQYAEASMILEFLPFRDIAGGALTYNREETMPGIGFRGVNSGFEESTGIVNPVVETLAIAGGDLDVDRFITSTMGADVRESQEQMKVRSLALAWERTFINGDTQTAPTEFDGLKKRLTGTQLVANATSGTAPLSLNNLDYAISRCRMATHLVMNVKTRLNLQAAARNTGVGGYITQTINEFGQPVTQYGNLPIIELEEDNEGNEILPFTEAGNGSGTDGSSIYVVSFRDMGLFGIQNGSIRVDDLGMLETKPALRTRVEWYAGIAIYDGRSASRLYGVADGAVTA